MSARVWNYLTGYVIIELKGKGLERFVNRAVHSGALLWCIRRTAADAVSARIGIKDFYRLRNLVRGTGIRVRVIDKRGVPVAISRAGGRSVMLFGWIVVAAALIIASRYIWFISIEGCDEVKETEILDLLEDLGVKRGVARSSVHTYALGGEISSGDDRIAWAGAKLDGVILRVTVAEAGHGVPEAESSEPQSLYAAKDGVVTRVTVKGGKAVVVTGDAVVKGQELISSLIRDDELGHILARAEGEVLAQVLYCAKACAGPKIAATVKTGETEYIMKVSLFGFSLFDGARDGYIDETVGRWKLTDCFLPVRFERVGRSEAASGMINADEETLRALAAARAEDTVKAMIPDDAVMLSKRCEYELNEDGSVTATVTVVTEENIAEYRGNDGEQYDKSDDRDAG